MHLEGALTLVCRQRNGELTGGHLDDELALAYA